jgi:CGNR zinc finger/Putative stress-induced transcription regulator
MARDPRPLAPVIDPTDPRPAPVDLEPLRRFVNTDNRYGEVDHLSSDELRRAWFPVLLPDYDAAAVSDAGWVRLVELRAGLRAVLGGASGEHMTALAAAYPARLEVSEEPRWVPVRDDVEHRLAVDLLGALHTAAADGRLERLRLCRRPDCGWCYYDASKNRSARWCSADPCGDVMKTRAFRERARARA